MSKDDEPVPSESQYTAARIIRDWREYGGHRVISVHEDMVIEDAQPKIIITPESGSATFRGMQGEINIADPPEILIQQAIEVLGDEVDEGLLIHSVAIPWQQILKEIDGDPNFLSKVDWRKMEELIAAAYKEAGCPSVIVTPRSNDKGHDVIATWPGHLSIRIIDQVKTYNPKHLVTAEEVWALIGVLTTSRNVSKGIVTTTSGFAPGIEKNPEIAALMPYKLDLRSGQALSEWLRTVAGKTIK
jgi:restriction system protein